MARHDATEGSPMVTVHVNRAEAGGSWAVMPEYPGAARAVDASGDGFQPMAVGAHLK